MTHSKSLPSAFSSLALILVLFAASACDCLPCSTGSSSVTHEYIQMAPMAPPAPLYEEMPVRTSTRTEIWHPGYWDYSGGDFHWVSGYMIDRPSATAVWSPDHWTEHKYGWAFVPGYWQ